MQDKDKNRAEQTKRQMDKLNEEIAQIWNAVTPTGTSDVQGSYTGTPLGFDEPEQDADDI